MSLSKCYDWSKNVFAMNKKHLPGFSLASVIISPNFSEKSQKSFVWQQIETFDLNVVFNTS